MWSTGWSSSMARWARPSRISARSVGRGWRCRGGGGPGAAPRPPVGRISMLKEFCGEDVTEWYPAKDVRTKGAAEWTYEKQLKMAEQVFKAGKLFALGCGASSTDANQTWGATFGAFGAHLVDGKGNVI